MTSQYLSEIRIMPYTFAPKGWAQCNGQIMAISQNQALFALLGTTYGGNGVTTFGLPDLRGKVPIGFNSAYPLGSTAGEPNHTLTMQETPLHTHNVLVDATTAASSSTALATPTSVLGQSAGTKTPSGSFTLYIYNTAQVDTQLAPQTISLVGGQPHSNMQPFLTLNFCIALTGIFPSRN
jgi:microcystin-dependent protein